MSVRFKILRVGPAVTRPASRDARRRGCTCPPPENRGGVGWDVSDDDDFKGFWVDEQCVVHGAEALRKPWSAPSHRSGQRSKGSAAVGV